MQVGAALGHHDGAMREMRLSLNKRDALTRDAQVARHAKHGDLLYLMGDCLLHLSVPEQADTSQSEAAPPPRPLHQTQPRPPPTVRGRIPMLPPISQDEANDAEAEAAGWVMVADAATQHAHDGWEIVAEAAKEVQLQRALLACACVSVRHSWSSSSPAARRLATSAHAPAASRPAPGTARRDDGRGRVR